MPRKPTTVSSLKGQLAELKQTAREKMRDRPTAWYDGPLIELLTPEEKAELEDVLRRTELAVAEKARGLPAGPRRGIDATLLAMKDERHRPLFDRQMALWSLANRRAYEQHNPRTSLPPEPEPEPVPQPVRTRADVYGYQSPRPRIPAAWNPWEPPLMVERPGAVVPEKGRDVFSDSPFAGMGY